MYKFIPLIILLFPSFSYAGTAGIGKITLIEFTKKGVVLFRHNGVRSGQASCVGSNFQNRWAIDATTDAGKAQLSGVLTAYTAGKNVTVIGENNCTHWGDSESVNYFYISG